MELEENQIINLAVNIFQNVGIKRYIGDIEALKHEEIYFEIYKIIFPDSMINIFKISESSLTTGEKIQKIIEEISSIIKLDLYHISGDQIAQGNINHITNWLQLLEALSNSFIPNHYQKTGGSAPVRDIDKDFIDDSFYTVIGIKDEFDKNHPGDINYSNPSSSDGTTIQNGRDYPPDSSNQSIDVLQPVHRQKKNKKKNKRVTFELKESRKSFKKNKLANNPSNLNSTVDTNQKNKRKGMKDKIKSLNKLSMYIKGWQRIEDINHMKKQHKYLNKMNHIVEQLERKNIYDKNIEFQNWAFQTNQLSKYEEANLQQENKDRLNFINSKIAEREEILESISGKQFAAFKIKKLFQAQRQKQQMIHLNNEARRIREMEDLLDPNFATKIQNQIFQHFAE